LAEKAMEVIGKREKMISFFLTVTILGIALVESAAIYGLVVAFDILSKDLALYAAAGAGAAIGFAGLGAGIGEGILVSGAMSAIARNPQIKGKILTFMVLFVALVEVTAIYGLIIAFQISGAEVFDAVAQTGLNPLVALGAGLAIGIAGLGVGIGRGYLSEESLKTMGKNPKMISFLLTVSILGVALVESAAIYALIVSFQILDKETLGGIAAIGAGLAIGLAGLGAGIGEGLLIKGAIKGINQNPELKGKVMAFMVLFVALIEVVAIYGMIIAFKVIDEGSKVAEETLKVIG
jgi:V/A-type H+-transporting ATPase subunit K